MPGVLMPDAKDVRLQLLRGVLVLVAVVMGGTGGYMVIERWSFWDAFFMTMISVTTVGYGEVRPLDREGEIFTVALLIAGVGGALYTLNAMVRITMEGELTGALAERRMRQRIEHLHGHVILCGYGRVGEEIARVLRERNEPFVLIDIDAQALARAEASGCDHIHGDATKDDVLRRAGVTRARCLITALDEDAENCWVVLSARALNEKLWIVARADQPESEPKLRQAGADRVIAPAMLAGGHMALAAVQPLVLDFTQTFVRADGMNLMLAQLTVQDGSALADQTLADALTDQESVIVLGVRRADGELHVKPEMTMELGPGDELIVLGRVDDLNHVNTRARANGVAVSRPGAAES